MATKKVIPWMFGNTTVRSPFRLRDGLLAISQSSLQGDLRGAEQEKAFRDLLGEFGIVSLGTDDTYSVGRKWRAALEKHGFLYPNLPAKKNINGYARERIDTITPSGWRLINAESVPAMQECFLRSLLSYVIPNALDSRYSVSEPFSPLRFTLSVMLELERVCGSNLLNFNEMALIVQFSNPSLPMPSIVERILKLRIGRERSDSKRAYDSETYQEAARIYSYEPQTFNDYADLNIRYLKATGLLGSKGRGIKIVDGKHLFVERVCSERLELIDDSLWLTRLINGSNLPTDNKDTAREVVDDLVVQLKSKGIQVERVISNALTAADINIQRYDYEQKLFELREQEYAASQSLHWREISGWLEVLSTSPYKSKSLDDGELIKVPQGEAPAYFEWIIWRSFLAINHLTNSPSECRRFKVDQDFFPVGTAPGNGPDLIFEFTDFVVVVEVTLTSSSRQEATEGEPVRRHVANIVDLYQDKNKPVYGLFLTNIIDSNTAETFRLGTWYKADDSKMRLTIVPIKLSEFKAFFDTIFRCEVVDHLHIRKLIERCSYGREADAPAWKNFISGVVDEYVSEIKSIG